MEDFEALEREISKAVDLIDKLKEERSGAWAENEELRERLSVIETQNEALKAENERLREEHQRSEVLVAEKKEKLRAQIERMLSRLESESG